MRTRGTTSIELLVVVTLVAVIAGIGVPTVRYVTDRQMVEGAAQLVLRSHREARMLAVVSQRTALLTIDADSIVLRTTRDGDTTLVWRRPGPASYGVMVGGASHLFRFIPYGYSVGTSNASYIFTRGSARRKVVIARYGRVRVE